MRADQGQGNTLLTKLQFKWEDILDANNCQRTSQAVCKSRSKGALRASS